MACHLISFVLISFFGSLLTLGIHGGAHIEIDPEHYTDINAENVHISCRPQELDKNAKEIVMLQIIRKGEKPVTIAEVHKSDKHDYIEEQSYEVRGHIDKEMSQSYLNVTLFQAEKDWSGVYVCNVFYMDHSGAFKQDAAEKAFVVERTLETYIQPLVEKISFLEERAEFLENKTVALENKATSLQDQTAALEKKSASLQKETSLLEKKASSLRDRTSILERASIDLENETLSQQEVSESIIEKVTLLEKKSQDQEEEIQSLVENDAIMDSHLAETNTKLELDIRELADNIDVASVRSRVDALEEASEKEKTDITADKASLSSMAEKIATLEQNEREDSTKIKSLADKESAIEMDVAKTNQNLTQEMNDRLADKATAIDVMDKVTSLEKDSEDHLNHIKSLTSKQSAIKSDLQKTDEKLSQEVSDRVNDKSAVRLITNKIEALKQMDEDHTNQLKTLRISDSALEEQLTSVEGTGAKQSQEIKSISDIFKDSVFPALRKLNKLQNVNGYLSKELKGLESKEIILDTRIGTLEEIHQTTTPEPTTPTPEPITTTTSTTTTTTTILPTTTKTTPTTTQKPTPSTTPEPTLAPLHYTPSHQYEHSPEPKRYQPTTEPPQKPKQESRPKPRCHVWDFLCRIYG